MPETVVQLLEPCYGLNCKPLHLQRGKESQQLITIGYGCSVQAKQSRMLWESSRMIQPGHQGRSVSWKDCSHEMEQMFTKRGKEKDYYGVKGKKILFFVITDQFQVYINLKNDGKEGKREVRREADVFALLKGFLERNF